MRRPAILSLVLAAALSAPLYAASAPQTNDLTPTFVSNGVSIDGLRVIEVGGIVVIRGRANDAAQAATASTVAQTLGYSRVANLVTVAPPVDDGAIARRAEREISMHRGLDGSGITVASRDGVVTLASKVARSLQRDAAIALVRNIDGVREVRTDFR
jgi:osmotically-inducible protein OsmY